MYSGDYKFQNAKGMPTNSNKLTGPTRNAPAHSSKLEKSLVPNLKWKSNLTHEVHSSLLQL